MPGRAWHGPVGLNQRGSILAEFLVVTSVVLVPCGQQQQLATTHKADWKQLPTPTASNCAFITKART